jgi:hypothetical protein
MQAQGQAALTRRGAATGLTLSRICLPPSLQRYFWEAVTLLQKLCFAAAIVFSSALHNVVRVPMHARRDPGSVK